MICTNHQYYFMLDLITGESTSEYLSLKETIDTLVCKDDTKVVATLNIEY